MSIEDTSRTGIPAETDGVYVGNINGRRVYCIPDHLDESRHSGCMFLHRDTYNSLGMTPRVHTRTSKFV